MADRSIMTFSSSPKAPVRTPHAMVASSQPLAVQTGVDVLKSGGTALDAAIAVNAMLGLVEPMSCGIGGDVFAILWDADSQRLHGLNGSGRAPGAISIRAIVESGYTFIPERGPLSWSIPGCVDGWFTLHERFGRLPMRDLLQPTIERANSGFSVTPVIAGMWERAAMALSEDAGAAEVYLSNGKAPREGERFRNPRLAETLASIARDGAEVFYQGPISDALVSYSEAMGGFFSRDDLAAHTSTWVDPVSIPFRDVEVWQLPPNPQGLAMLQMLRILEPYDLSAMEHNGPEYLHLLIEAKKLAYEDRARLYADPDYFDVPVEALLSDVYADRLRSRLSHDRAAVQIEVDDPRSLHGDTVYLTVVDGEGNAVSFIQSIFHDFGSRNVPADLGFALQSRGCLFNLDPSHANALVPGKRPFQTIMPGFVTRKGRPVFSFGVMGGDMQPQGQLQVLLNLIEFGMDPQLAGDALRVRHDGSSTPVGHAMSDGGTVKLEVGFPESVRSELEVKGHRVEMAERGFGGYQGIWLDEENGILIGGSEPRKDGCVLGF